MALYNNRIATLESLMTDCLQGNHPREFSFLGVMEDHIFLGPNSTNPGRFEFELVLQTGTRSRLRVLYNTGADQHSIYDDRHLDESECVFYPKGSLVFLPRLDLLYIEGDTLFCQFRGGDELLGSFYDKNLGMVRKIGANRVMIVLDTYPSMIEDFLENKKVVF